MAKRSKEVTAWYRRNEAAERWEFNHIQDGHIEGWRPLGSPAQNRSWARGKWKKEFKHITKDGRLV